MIQTGFRHGYWVIQWKENWDPSLKELVERFPELVTGNHVAVVCCDSGSYKPETEELVSGWQIGQGTALSPIIKEPAELPMPGFDEWYIFKVPCSLERYDNFVNTFGFSPLETDNEQSDAFWRQVQSRRPLHVLGAGTPVMFLVTSDEALYKKISGA
jgi:hypothetical protein